MRDDPAVVSLVRRAHAGDKDAWDEIVERYAPLVWATCRAFRLSRDEADDVAQTVWLALLDHRLREPAALPGWLATVTRRECGRRSASAAWQRTHLRPWADHDAPADDGPVDRELLEAERNTALYAGFRQLGERCRALLSLLVRLPPAPYEEISTTLGIPVGSIGPTRGRCLAELRKRPEVAALIRSEGG